MITQNILHKFQVETKQIMTDLTSAVVTDDPEKVRELVKIHEDPYTAASGAHALVICTEWDEFVVRENFIIDYHFIFEPLFCLSFIIHR